MSDDRSPPDRDRGEGWAAASPESRPRGRGRRPFLAIAWVLLAIVLLGAAGFVVWASDPLGPDAAALAASSGGDGVAVTQAADGYEFAPASVDPTAGIVLYPGGHVDVRSYAPLARELASRGYLVVVPPMTLSLAVFSPYRADAVLAKHPRISTWAVGGHSLGGTMAALWAGRNLGRVKALVLLASYPAAGTDLSRSGLRVISLRGSADALVTTAKIDAARPLLPSTTVYVTLPGGNHGQFGSYGPQPGDGAATISPQRQRIVTAEIVDAFLRGSKP